MFTYVGGMVDTFPGPAANKGPYLRYQTTSSSQKEEAKSRGRKWNRALPSGGLRHDAYRAGVERDNPNAQGAGTPDYLPYQATGLTHLHKRVSEGGRWFVDDANQHVSLCAIL